MTIHLFPIANVKQLRTGGSFKILLPFILTSWCVGVLNSVIFNSFRNRVEFGTILEDLRIFGRGGGGFEPPQTPLRFGTPLFPAFLQVFEGVPERNFGILQSSFVTAV